MPSVFSAVKLDHTPPCRLADDRLTRFCDPDRHAVSCLPLARSRPPPKPGCSVTPLVCA